MLTTPETRRPGVDASEQFTEIPGELDAARKHTSTGLVKTRARAHVHALAFVLLINIG